MFPQVLPSTISLAFLALAITPFAAAQALPPLQDSNYAVPSNIGTFPNGAIIPKRTRVVSTSLGFNATQIFYKTTGMTNNNPDMTVATVWAPTTPFYPPKIVSYQPAEDSTELNCAPSFAVRQGTTSNNTGAVGSDFKTTVKWALDKGYYVVAADLEGSKSAWLVGNIEGHAVLDAIRATRNQFNLPNETAVALTGYSGGAHATVWAASLAQTYAPDVNITGAAYGGTIVDLLAVYQWINNGPLATPAATALIGLANGYPALDTYLTNNLSPAGLDYRALVRRPDYCAYGHPFALAGQNLTATLFKKTSNPFAPGSVLSKILASESLLQNVTTLPVPVPKFPRYEYHGGSDSLVPYDPEAQYVQQQCKQGANIAFNRYPGNHPDTAIAGLLGALQFVDQALKGTTPKVFCGTNIPRITLNDTQAAVAMVTEPVVDGLINLYNKLMSERGTQAFWQS